MFEETLLDSALSKKTRIRRAAIPLACAGQSLLVGALILIPLFRTQALPRIESNVWTPAPPFYGTPHPIGDPAIGHAPSHNTSVKTLEVPPKIPPTIIQITEDLQPPALNPFGGRENSTGPLSNNPGQWVPGSVDLGHSTPPPPTPPVHLNPTPRIVTMGGKVIAARALYQPRPIYPRVALMAHVQGAVVLQAILARDGSVQDLKVISGHPLLIQAALDAVKTWRYQPTLLNSEPVEVLTEIDVNFTLEE